MKKISIWITASKEIFSFSSILVVLIIGIFYSLFSVFLLNYRLFFDPNSSFFYKVQLLLNLLPGLWTGLSLPDFILFVITAILVGLNILMLYKSIMFLKHKGKIKLSIGGATIIAFVTTGCLSCGLSVLSVLGLSASLSFLPFRGMELHLLSLITLIFSFSYMFWELHRVKYCKIN
jgi:hypothetical protein